MANDNYARGLVPYRCIGANYYRVSTAADIYLGQPVALGATGYVSTISANGITQMLGVAIGFAGTKKGSIATNDPFLDVSDLTPPDPSSDTGDRFVLVADDPQQEYYVQEDSGGTALALADIFSTIDMTFRGDGTSITGDANTGWATLEIDASSVAQDTGQLLSILRLHDVINSDGTENGVGDYAKWVVKALHHQRQGANIVPTA